MSDMSGGWISDLYTRLDEIDSLIEKDYQNIVVKRYLPLFSEIVKESSRLLIEKNIPAIKLGHHSNYLTFLQTGVFMKEGEYIYPQRTEADSLEGILKIVRVFKNESLTTPTERALRLCLCYLIRGVDEAVEKN